MADPHESIYEATLLVAREFDGPHCVEAAALLVELGSRLGNELEAIPVSMAAFSDNGQSVATGEKGRAFAQSYLERRGQVAIGGEFEGGSPFERRAGHMIVVSREDRLLLDPTFSQFKQFGEHAIGLYVSEVDPHKSGKFWEVGDAHLLARYFVSDEHLSELGFDKLRAAASGRADELAAEVEHRLTSA